MTLPPDLVDAVKRARSVVVLTGAGMSAESGVPTFRDAMDGLWAQFDPMELATPEAFDRQPELVARWYDERRRRCLDVKPHAGHRALAAWEAALHDRGRSFLLTTQNVDRLHHRAGSRQVVELHGAISMWRCTACGAETEETGPAFSCHPPRCACGGTKRPGVVWFGEDLPLEALERTRRALAECDFFLSVGTSAVVFPAADFVHQARIAGAQALEVNLEATPVSEAFNWNLFQPAGEALPALFRAASALRSGG